MIPASHRGHRRLRSSSFRICLESSTRWKQRRYASEGYTLRTTEGGVLMGQAVRSGSRVHRLGSEQWSGFRPWKNRSGNFPQKTPPTATVKIGANAAPFKKEATRWRGIWLYSQLTSKEHHAIRLKSGKKVMARATTRRPTMQGAPPSQGCGNRLREERLHRSESQSLQTPKPSSDAWLRTARPGNIIEIR